MLSWQLLEAWMLTACCSKAVLALQVHADAWRGQSLLWQVQGLAQACLQAQSLLKSCPLQPQLPVPLPVLTHGSGLQVSNGKPLEAPAP